MASIDSLIEQVRAVLIETEDAIAKHEIYNRFINECRAYSLSEDDFYKNVLKPAYKSIDWNELEEQIRIKELQQIDEEFQEAFVLKKTRLSKLREKKQAVISSDTQIEDTDRSKRSQNKIIVYLLPILLVLIATGWYFIRMNGSENTKVSTDTPIQPQQDTREKYDNFFGQEYNGKVDGEEIKMKIKWNTDETISAIYYVLSAPQNIHDWQGSNYTPGELKFTEFSNGNKIGEGVLSKTLAQRTIYWSGELYRANGTRSVISIYRTRE